MINKKIFNEIISEFKDNESIIKKALDIEAKYWDFKFDIKKAIDIVKNFEPKQNNLDKKYLVIYYGNPYATLNICLESIYKNIDLSLVAEEYFLGLNKIIVQIFNNVLKDYRIKKIKIDFFEPNFDIKKYLQTNNFDNIINLGNHNRSYDLEHTTSSFKFYNYGNSIVLNDSEDYLDLLQDFLFFTGEANFEIDCFNLWEEELDDILNFLDEKENKDKIIIYFTKNATVTNELYVKLKNMPNAFINRNPFQNWNYTIPNIFSN